jgi:hypothetical protein
MKSSVLFLAAIFLSGEVLNGHAAASGGAAAGGGASSGAAGASGGAAFGTPSASGRAGAPTSPSGNNGANSPAAARPNALVPNAQTSPAMTPTNVPPGTNPPPTGTNQVNVTNQVFNTNQVNVTNQVFSTNFVSITNRVGLGANDLAATEFDRALIVNVRQRIFIKDPGISASWDTLNFAANGGTILVSGTMLNALDKNQLLVLTRNTPGVVGVIDHVLVTPNGNTANNTGGQQFLNPNPDPSLGDKARFGAATPRPPARSTFTNILIGTNVLTPTGSTNVTTNVVLEGTNIVGTNVIVVPVETNSTSP